MSTALTEVPGWYIEFQAALLRQAPRPGEIDQVTAEGWTSNQKVLKKNLAGCLLPPPATVSAEQQRNWREQDGIIYFSVKSNGMTGEQWIVHLEAKGYSVADYAKSVLCSPDFKPTKGVTTEIAVLKSELFNNYDRTTTKIRVFAADHKLEAPNAEVACLIREMFTNKEIKAMDLCSIVAMHKPIKDSSGISCFLGANTGNDRRWLTTFHCGPGGEWGHYCGFAFAVSQASSQT